MESDKMTAEQVRELSQQTLRKILKEMEGDLTPKQKEFLSLPELTEQAGLYALRENGSEAHLSHRGEAIYLVMIQTDEAQRGQGHASKLLKRICALADKVGVTLALRAEPKAAKIGLSQEQLVEWYGKHGFKGDWNEMTRLPSEDAG